MGLWEDLKARHKYKSLGKPRLVVGIPTINRKDLLIESLADLSTNMGIDIHKLIIIDNGKQSISDIVPHLLKGITDVHTQEKNLGVSGSWNKIIKEAYFSDSPADHLLIINDDVVLGKTFEDIIKVTEDNPGYTMLNCTYYWSSFLITRECVDEVGFFDAKFFPAYFEDNDYARRHSLLWGGNKIKTRRETPGLDPVVKRNSSTIRQNPSLNSGFGKNANYYRKKWGGSLGHEKFINPFNGEPQDDE
jgi:glycosyltransferase involved in cell wall biosynthesis